MCLSKCWRAAQCLLSVPLCSSCLLNTAQILLGTAVSALFGRDKKAHPLKPVTWKIQSPLCLPELARKEISPIWEPGSCIRTAVNTKSPRRDLFTGTGPCTAGSGCVGKAAWAMTLGFTGCPAHYSSAFVIKWVRKEMRKRGRKKKKERKGEEEKRERTG